MTQFIDDTVTKIVEGMPYKERSLFWRVETLKQRYENTKLLISSGYWRAAGAFLGIGCGIAAGLWAPLSLSNSDWRKPVAVFGGGAISLVSFVYALYKFDTAEKLQKESKKVNTQIRQIRRTQEYRELKKSIDTKADDPRYQR